MRTAASIVLCIFCTVICQTGCAVLDAGRDMTQSGIKAFKPRTRDYHDSANDKEYVDEWQSYGRDARGDAPLEHESDGLTKYVQSPKARAIERSLGFD